MYSLEEKENKRPSFETSTPDSGWRPWGHLPRDSARGMTTGQLQPPGSLWALASSQSRLEVCALQIPGLAPWGGIHYHIPATQVRWQLPSEALMWVEGTFQKSPPLNFHPQVPQHFSSGDCLGLWLPCNVHQCSWKALLLQGSVLL